MNISGGMSINPSQMAQSMQDKFKVADVDESGAVSKEEFLAAAEEDTNTKMLDKMFERLDSDGNGEISAAEQQAMAEQMAQRAEKMAQMQQGGGGSSDIFSSLLNSLSSDDEESNATDSYINQLKEQLASGEMSKQDMAKSMMEVNKKYPRINTTA